MLLLLELGPASSLSQFSRACINDASFLLRRLYVTVITTIHGFGDLFWMDVVAQMDTMNDTVLAFQAQAKKLPKVRLNLCPTAPPFPVYSVVVVNTIWQ